MATIAKYEAGDGSPRWEVRYRKPDGRTTRRRGFNTQRDAKAFAATTETAKLKGEFVSVSVGKITVGELGPAWLERQRGHLKPSSFDLRERAWRVHVAPRWADVRLANVRFTDVQAWITEMSTTLGPSMVDTVHLAFAAILDDAVKDRMLAANPARGVKKPKASQPRQIYLTADQLNMLANESGEYRSLVLLLGIGGLRWGEATALRPCDIDFLRRRIELHRNVVRVGGSFHAGTLKSGKNRTVVVPRFVMDALAQTAEGKGREDLMWTAPWTGGYLQGPGQPQIWLPRAVRRCQAADPAFPRITPHALRHTAASLAISAGANPKVVQRMLGQRHP
jgi:integrase